jgi:hypothetical protein
MEPGCMAGSHTNNLRTHTDLSKNRHGEKKTGFFKAANQKSATVVARVIAIARFNNRGRFLKMF